MCARAVSYRRGSTDLLGIFRTPYNVKYKSAACNSPNTAFPKDVDSLALRTAPWLCPSPTSSICLQLAA